MYYCSFSTKQKKPKNSFSKKHCAHTWHYSIALLDVFLTRDGWSVFLQHTGTGYILFSEFLIEINLKRKLKLNIAICMRSSVQKGYRVGTGVLKWIWKVWCTSRPLLGMPAHYSISCILLLSCPQIQLLSPTHDNLQISAAYPKFTEVIQIQYTPTFKLTINWRNKELKIYLTFNSDYT